MVMIWPLVVMLFAAGLWISSASRWTGWRRVAVVYGVASVFAGGLTLVGWLSDCAPHEIDGQCGMSTAFMALIGLLGAFIIVVLGHLLPALNGPRPRARLRKRSAEQVEVSPTSERKGPGAI